MCAYFVDVAALEDVIFERVKVTSAWTEGFVSWFEEWESKFAFACWDKYPGSRVLARVMVGWGIGR